jgi:hypothetical protein
LNSSISAIRERISGEIWILAESSILGFKHIYTHIRPYDQFEWRRSPWTVLTSVSWFTSQLASPWRKLWKLKSKGQSEGKGLQPERRRRTVPLDYAGGRAVVALGVQL